MSEGEALVLSTPGAHREMEPKRVRVPNDNSCLFYAICYVCEESADAASATTAAKQQELRGVCAAAARADPDPVSRALQLGQDVEAYATWIMKEHNWGGEHEVICLADHYRRRVAVVSADATLTYGDAGPTAYLFYTGTHYDALVGECGGEETRRFAGGGGEAFEAACAALARTHRDAAARREASEKIYTIKCSGCGAKLADAAAFQAHCGEVEHDDDFAYDCETIFEAVYDDDAA